MRDEETGSWWQQVTGEAIYGALKGQRLRPVQHDELTFATWKREQPQGRVLKPDEHAASADKYESADWEERMQRVKVATTTAKDALLDQRELVVGIEISGAAKAYPLSALVTQSPVLDTLGGVPVLIVVADDHKSVRAYESTVDGRKLEFFKQMGVATLQLVDAQTGSAWDFTGKCVNGALAGRQLQKISILEDYWFDWKTYHPNTSVYKLGAR